MKYVVLMIVLVVVIWIAMPSHPSSGTSSVSGASDLPTPESKESGSPRHATLSAEELKRLKDSQQYDLDLIDAIQAVLTASPNDAVTAYCIFTIKQAEALTQAKKSASDAQNQWYEQQNIGVCRARILTGVNMMPSPDKFREYEAKAQRDLIETNRRLASAGTILETPTETPDQANDTRAQSECLSYGIPVRLRGTIVQQTYPGRPNYESVAKGDEPETVWILDLDSLICTLRGNDIDEPAENGVDRLQLVFDQAGMYDSYRSLLGKPVTATGNLGFGITAHYHTRVALATRNIEP
jgi:hypothetical protein